MYALGVDLGTTFTAAAVWRDGRAEITALGGRAAVIPSVVLLRSDETFVTGETAARRALSEPDRVAREFKRRLGDTTPLLLGGVPYSAEALTARLLRSVVDDVTAREGGAPALICVSHPANWGPYKTDLLRQAARLADLSQPVTFITEPEAAAVYYAQQQRVEPGAVVAVYDLGGGTFDAAVLRKTDTGFEILGQPEGIERLGGIDFDAAVFSHVARIVGDKLTDLDEDEPAAVAAVARLRDECVAAKEALSTDTDATIPVLLPTVSTEVRLTRPEFEAMVRPALYDSIEAMKRALRSAGVGTDDLQSVLLVGGSSRMPIVSQLVTAELGRPVAIDVHPKHAIALGCAYVASTAPAQAAGQRLGGGGPAGGGRGPGGPGPVSRPGGIPAAGGPLPGPASRPTGVPAAGSASAPYGVPAGGPASAPYGVPAGGPASAPYGVPAAGRSGPPSGSVPAGGGGAGTGPRGVPAAAGERGPAGAAVPGPASAPGGVPAGGREQPATGRPESPGIAAVQPGSHPGIAALPGPSRAEPGRPKRPSDPYGAPVPRRAPGAPDPARGAAPSEARLGAAPEARPRPPAPPRPPGPPAPGQPRPAGPPGQGRPAAVPPPARPVAPPSQGRPAAQSRAAAPPGQSRPAAPPYRPSTPNNPAVRPEFLSSKGPLGHGGRINEDQTEILSRAVRGGGAPPAIPRQAPPAPTQLAGGGGNRLLIVVIIFVIAAILAALGGVAYARRHNGNTKPAGAANSDEQCTDAIKANPRWVCLTKATFDGKQLVLEYQANFAGQTPRVGGGYHLHIYGGDGTNPPASSEGTQAASPGRWYDTDDNPSIRPADSADYQKAIGNATKVCARIANPHHELVNDPSGNYATGNCIPITRI
jgi:actin-like ATPase involved in cell morphogenesis